MKTRSKLNLMMTIFSFISHIIYFPFLFHFLRSFISSNFELLFVQVWILNYPWTFHHQDFPWITLTKPWWSTSLTWIMGHSVSPSPPTTSPSPTWLSNSARLWSWTEAEKGRYCNTRKNTFTEDNQQRIHEEAVTLLPTICFFLALIVLSQSNLQLLKILQYTFRASRGRLSILSNSTAGLSRCDIHFDVHGHSNGVDVVRKIQLIEKCAEKNWEEFPSILSVCVWPED